MFPDYIPTSGPHRPTLRLIIPRIDTRQENMLIGILKTFGIGAVDFGTFGGEGLGNRPSGLSATYLADTIVIGGSPLQACCHSLLRQDGIGKDKALGRKISCRGYLQNGLDIVVCRTPTERGGMRCDVSCTQRLGSQASTLAKRDIVDVPTLGIRRRESDILARSALQAEREALPTLIGQVLDQLGRGNRRIGIGERVDCHEGIGIVRVRHGADYQQSIGRRCADLACRRGGKRTRIEIDLNGIEIGLQLRHSSVSTERA